MTKRDLHADLAICNAATAGPLYVVDVPSGIYATEIDGDVFAECERLEDARFITEARTGWPHAIERAMAAEAEVERLRRIAEYAQYEAAGFAELRSIDIAESEGQERMRAYWQGEKIAYERMAEMLSRIHKKEATA